MSLTTVYTNKDLSKQETTSILTEIVKRETESRLLYGKSFMLHE